MARPTTSLVVGFLALGAVFPLVARSLARGEAGKPGDADAVPLDVSFLPPDAPGALALRPAALFHRPALAGVRGLVEDEIAAFLKEVNIKGRFLLGLDEIEQVTGRMWARTDPKKKENKHSLIFSLFSIRCVRDFDWKRQMHEFFPDAVEVPHAGGVFYHCALPPCEAVPKGGEATWWIPDGRTIVFDSDKNLRRLIERKGKPGSSPAWAEGWRQVEHGLAACVVDGRASSVVSWIDKADKDAAPLVLPLGKVEWVTAGLDAEGRVQAIADCGSKKGSESLVRSLRTLLGTARFTLTQPSAASPGGAREKSAEDRLAETFLSSATVAREGNRVLLHAETGGHLEAALHATLTAAGDEKSGTPEPKK
jgi:hypothetical protein